MTLYKPKMVTKHLESGKNITSTYRTWRAMKTRCLNKNSKDYCNYGGRGISICNKWIKSYLKFLEDMGDRPKNKTLDRIDNNGNYCKENCRWATIKKQSNNARHNVKLEFEGKKLSISEWARLKKINIYTLHDRINRLNWSIKKALTTKTRKKIKYNDKL